MLRKREITQPSNQPDAVAAIVMVCPRLRSGAVLRATTEQMSPITHDKAATRIGASK